ncbi:unnamed protein product [Linum tenue]|uniref:Uncharacterized protein n=1 Tax=Linum tenue TaxID=586396 RepID=A0AAV0NV26_9ROSI|nr:unnamed protein product [Linum tenue]
MHDYLTGGFTANTSLAHYCRDNGLLLHIHTPKKISNDLQQKDTCTRNRHNWVGREYHIRKSKLIYIYIAPSVHSLFWVHSVHPPLKVVIIH